MFWEILLRLFLSLPPSFTTGLQPPAIGPAPAAADVVAQAPAPLAPPRTSVGDATSVYPVLAAFVLPNETVPVAVDSAPAESARVSRWELQAAAGTAQPAGNGRWTWTAPRAPGLYPLEIRDAASGQATRWNVFVMVPYAAMRHGRIHGYRIGNYPRTRPGHEAQYARPRGFVEVTPAVMDAAVSPHFTLAQFVCKQDGGFPKYLTLRQPLLVKLEQLLAEVNRRGIHASTFSIMSAYRTPTYNAAIGNVTVYSRHEYGDAADIFVDEDHDGIMDDLNGDGRHTIADARVLQGIVDASEDEPAFAGLTGGLGTYPPTSEHGPFVHVDVRGFDVRWTG